MAAQFWQAWAPFPQLESEVPAMHRPLEQQPFAQLAALHVLPLPVLVAPPPLPVPVLAAPPPPLPELVLVLLPLGPGSPPPELAVPVLLVLSPGAPPAPVPVIEPFAQATSARQRPASAVMNRGVWVISAPRGQERY
jgi:hypothetical protein